METWFVKMRVKPSSYIAPVYSETFQVAYGTGAYAKKGVGSLWNARHWATKPVPGMISRRRSLQ